MATFLKRVRDKRAKQKAVQAQKADKAIFELAKRDCLYLGAVHRYFPTIDKAPPKTNTLCYQYYMIGYKPFSKIKGSDKNARDQAIRYAKLLKDFGVEKMIQAQQQLKVQQAILNQIQKQTEEEKNTLESCRIATKFIKSQTSTRERNLKLAQSKVKKLINQITAAAHSIRQYERNKDLPESIQDILN